MKFLINYQFGLVFLFLLTFFSCSDKNNDFDISDESTLKEHVDYFDEYLESEEVILKYKNILSNNCIPVHDLKVAGDYVSIQNDVIFERKEVDRLFEKTGGIERARKFGDKPTNVDNIRILIEAGFHPNIVTAINSALQEWENIPNCRVGFTIVTSNPDITIVPDENPNNIPNFPSCLENLGLYEQGRAFGPQNGNVGQWISINDAYRFWAPIPLRNIVQHEIGHALGFFHSDVTHGNVYLECNNGPTSPNKRIACTLNSEVGNNIMESRVDQNLTNFSNDEIMAATYRWPEPAWAAAYKAQEIAQRCPFFPDFDSDPSICSFDGGIWYGFMLCTGEYVGFCCTP